MRFLALVDYDNVRLVQERTPFDAHSNIDALLDQLVEVLAGGGCRVTEVDVRLYGGWVTEDGTYSRLAEWALAAVSGASGRRKGIRFVVRLVVSPACRPEIRLLGTVRMRSPRPRQKMVDVLLAVDALHLAREAYDGFLLLSDDDDLVPCAVSLAAAKPRSCTVMRLRSPGSGLNDVLLSGCGVRLGVLRSV